jgi:hypothetical protein
MSTMTKAQRLAMIANAARKIFFTAKSDSIVAHVSSAHDIAWIFWSEQESRYYVKVKSSGYISDRVATTETLTGARAYASEYLDMLASKKRAYDATVCERTLVIFYALVYQSIVESTARKMTALINQKQRNISYAFDALENLNKDGIITTQCMNDIMQCIDDKTSIYPTIEYIYTIE